MNNTAYPRESGGHFGGVDTLKTRLLPWLGTCFSMATPSVSKDTSLQLIQVILSLPIGFISKNVPLLDVLNHI